MIRVGLLEPPPLKGSSSKLVMIANVCITITVTGGHLTLVIPTKEVHYALTLIIKGIWLLTLIWTLLYSRYLMTSMNLVNLIEN